MSLSVTTISFFKFKSIRQKVWAFGQMQFAHASLATVSGLTFYKLMGSGREIGFNPAPDWGVYAMLAVWEDETAAMAFLKEAEVFKKYEANSEQQWTLFLRVRHAHGVWSGKQPFQTSNSLDDSNPLMAVITRATIRWSKMIDFWRYVPTSQRPLQNGFDGLLYTKGVGEVPLVQMATFSIWRDIEALRKFAYESKEHQVAIQKTKLLNWYKEELFARFQPYQYHGVWDGLEKQFSLPAV